MEKIIEICESIWTLNTDQIAIISLLITLALFMAGKFSENRLKRYETRKEQYQKLIDFFKEIALQRHDQKSISEFANDPKVKEHIFDMGASIAIYGSKKLYKTYYFYRMLSIDTNIQQSRWYTKDMLIYALAEMYKIMRKEIGLNNDIFPIAAPDMLAFYLFDFARPEYKKNFYKYHYNKFVIKSAVFWRKIENFLPIIWLNNYIIKPLFFLCFCIIRFPIKLLIITPIKLIKNWKKSK